MTLSFAPERIEQWPLARLQPYARNAKAHGADQVARCCQTVANRSQNGQYVCPYAAQRQRHSDRAAARLSLKFCRL